MTRLPTYLKKLFMGGVLVVTLVTLSLPTPTSAADSVAWYSPDWRYRQKITVNHELVGGSVDGFPMLVKLSGKVFEHAQSDGDDILFTAADGTTKLLHEIESMNGEVVAWVQMPNLSEKEDTVLYVYYGNPAAENQQQATNVWGNGYVGVWHLNQNPSDRQQDATINDHDGTPTNIDSQEGKTTGKIGPAVHFDGVNNYLNVGNVSSSLFSSEFTASAWLYHTAGSTEFIWGKGTASGDGTEFFVRYPQARYEFRIDRTTGGDVLTNDGAAALNQWQHVVVTRDLSNNTKIYVNGSEAGSATVAKNGSDAATMLIGDSATSPGVIGWLGRIDNIAFLNVARTGAWIKTEYNNQSGSENFLTIAEPETQSASTATVRKSSTLTLSSPTIQAINQLFRTAYEREPTFTDWLYWAGRIIAKEKTTLPELLGAMQWQSLFAK